MIFRLDSENEKVIKAHGSEIKVETKEGEGSEFIILLHH
jgi:signal transduction histidine kinase